MKKIIVLLLVISFVLLVYFKFDNDKINYVSLGDSISYGINSYGERTYGYPYYIKDYLSSKNKLNSYYDFSKSGYKIKDIVNDINEFKKIDNHNIKEILRESDLVTISIGANDLIDEIDIENFNVNDIDLYLKKTSDIFPKLDQLFKIIREYAKNRVVVIGYYNPYPVLFNSYEVKLDIFFLNLDRYYSDLCKKYNFDYMSIYDLFKNNPSFLPNPNNPHPNIDGYKAITNRFIKMFLE